MGPWTFLIAIGSGTDGTPVFVRAAATDSGQLVTQWSSVVGGALFPGPAAVWSDWYLTDQLTLVSRTLFFAKGAAEPSLVVDTVPDQTTVSFHATWVVLDGRLPAVVAAADSLSYQLPPIQLEIAGLGVAGAPFDATGSPVFTTGYLGDRRYPIPIGTGLPALVNYPGQFNGWLPGPAVAVSLGLKTNAAAADADWKLPVHLAYEAIDPTRPAAGSRLVMWRAFELATASQPIQMTYYLGLGLTLARTTTPTIRAPGWDFPANTVQTRFIQMQPADILTSALSAKVTDPPAWEVVLEGIAYRVIQDVWNRLVARPYYLSIRTAAESQPISVVPFWRDTDRLKQIPPPAVTEPVYALRFRIDGWQDASTPVEKISLVLSRLELTEATLAPHPFPRIATQLEFPGLIDHDGAPLTIPIDDEAAAPDRSYIVKFAAYAPSKPLKHGVISALWPIGDGGDKNDVRRVRIGALDLGFLRGGAGLSFDPAVLQLAAQADFEILSIDDETRVIVRPKVLDTSYLPMLNVFPGAQDAPTGDAYLSTERDQPFARPPSLVFSTAADSDTAGGDQQVVALGVQEDTGTPELGDSQSPKVTLSLYQPSGSAPDFGHVVILDPSPFTIAQVNAKLQGQTTTNLLGSWTNGGVDGAAWQLALDPTGFALTLPPQAVAETMSKDNSAGAFGAGQFSDVRFSPTAIATLDAAPFRQQFVEPYWNLRRRLGFPGQRTPGSGLSRLRFELLYGLQINVDAAFMQLAEMQSRVGAAIGPFDTPLPWNHVTKDQKTELGAAQHQWATMLDRLDRRLGLLEVWSPEQPGEFRLDTNVHFTQRSHALGEMRDPLNPTVNPAGIQGGWMWGFESRNILSAVLRSPDSTSGELARPALSALGGWGWQKAKFDEDRTSVIADTAMGRTNFYSLERIGRIATFWNKAKHVIVYERTVRQRRTNFSNDQLQGRPVLRKVAEYVEILQSTRTLPDGAANPLAMGFFQSVEFPKQNNTNPRIPVQGAWGSDVNALDLKGDAVTGWQVPLWNVNADPTGYPKPHIVSSIATVPGSATQAAAAEHDNPELFRFYTSTVVGDGADPNKWQPVQGIDAVDRPLPNLGANLLRNDDLDATLPPPAPVAVGLENFTFSLVPSPIKANLTAGRHPTPIGATLRNVVVMRGARTAAQGVPPDLVPVQAVGSASAYLDNIEQTAATILASADPDAPLSGILTTLKSALAGLGTVADYQKAMNDIATGADLSKAILGQLANKNPCDYLKQRATDGINKYADTLRNQITVLQTQLNAALNAIPRTELTRFKTEAHVVLGKLVDPLTMLSSDVDDALGSASAALQAADRATGDARMSLTRECDTFIRGLAAAAGTPLPAAWDPITRALLDDIEAYRRKLEAISRSACAAVKAVGNLRLGKLTMPGTDLETALDTVRRALPTVLATLRARVTVAIAGVPTPAAVTGILTDLTNLATTARDTMRGQLDAVRGLLQHGFDGLDEAAAARDAAYDQLTGALGTAVADFDHVVDNATSALDCINQISTKLGDCINDVTGTYKAALITAVTDAIQTNVCDRLSGLSWEDERKALATLLDQGGDAVKRIGNELDALVAPTVAQASQAVSDLISSMRADVDQIAGQAMTYIDTWKQTAKQYADVFFARGFDCSLPRALVEAPEALGQAINRELVALHFDQLLPTIDMTPVAVLVDRVGDELKSLGVRMPSVSLLNGFIPDTKGLGIGDLFPDFSGLKFDGLFQGISLPDLSTDQMISHGIDAQTRRAWVQATVDVPMQSDMTILSWEVFELHLLNARFQATSRISAGVGGAVQRSAKGIISGDWLLMISGSALVTFRGTSLTFDNGHVSFNLPPKNIDLSGGLAFLTTYLQDAESFLPDLSDAGVSMRLIQVNGAPVGAEALLELPLPPLDFGTFGIANITLTGCLGLGLLPDGKESNFGIRLMFGLASQTEPFTLTIFVLGGGGWLSADATYFPSTGHLYSDVTISFGATARLAINFEVVAGAVEFYFGLAAEFHSGSGSTTFSLAIVFTIDGSVTVLGLLSIDLNLTLEVIYADGHATGYGMLHVRAKLGPFFKISVDKSVTCALGGGGGQQSTHSQISASAHAYHSQLDQEG